jgi:gas vesicle protein
MGYIRGVIHGTAIGTVVGLCIAPQEGSRTRAQLSKAIEQTRATVQRAQGTARVMMPKAQNAARTVVEQVEKIRHHDEQTEPYVSVNGGGNGSPGGRP